MNNTNQKRTITLYGKTVKLWSKEEDTELIELKKKGKDIYYISENLGRTTNAIKKRINNEISESFNYAKKSDFPIINSLEDLNLSKETPVADKILKEVEETNFDADQKVILPKGY